MEMIKEATPSGQCVIRNRGYGSCMDYFLEMMQAAMKDFPELTPSSIEVKHYGGRHYKGTFGIEFKMDLDKINYEVYREISQLEFTA